MLLRKRTRLIILAGLLALAGVALADSLEHVEPYRFIIGELDTYDLAALYAGYADYGDNEFIARQAEPAGVAVAKLNEDWSRGGAQWRR